jgi:hypothetical protein
VERAPEASESVNEPKRGLWVGPAALGAAALAVALAGCGREAPAPEARAERPAPDLFACELLPNEEAEAIAGEALDQLSTPLDAEVSHQAAKCSWGPGLRVPIRVVSLEVRRFESAERARRAHETAVEALRRYARDGLVTVPGLGDGAVWPGGALWQLHAVKDDLRLIATVELGDESRRREAAEGIVRRALERLDRAPS